MSTFCIGKSRVQFAALDAAGNLAKCSAEVTVHDDTEPSIACPTWGWGFNRSDAVAAGSAYHTDPGASFATLTLPAATATDNDNEDSTDADGADADGGGDPHSPQRKPRVLAVINPFSGTKVAARRFRKECAPILAHAFLASSRFMLGCASSM